MGTALDQENTKNMFVGFFDEGKIQNDSIYLR